MTTAYQYPFDPSGTSTANRITNEQHVITAANFRDYHYVIPDFAPFFEGNFSIRLQFPNGTVRPLVQGVDYYFSNQFLDASRACAKPVYGSISFLDTDTAGILSISYNTVGGEWNLTPAEISRILAEELRNPRITTWEQITNLPERFPVVDHEWDLIDMVGMTPVVTAIQQLRDAVVTKNGGGLSDHINNYSNPHNVTKAQVGLGNLFNFPLATTADAQAGTSNSFYMTPLRVKDAITALSVPASHLTDYNNPHQTTKAQVGLGNVANYAVSTTAEAQAGAVDTSYMTPLKTSQAITAQVGTAFAAHVANQLNPHNVTAAQVGLFNVQNYQIATQAEALAGTASDKYMTPQRTTQLVQQYVSVNLDAHASRTDNPHQTTATQVGLGNVQNFAIATQVEAQVGASNTAYMTPGRTADAINALATPAAHLLDMNNPHQTTAAQVGLGNVSNYGIATQADMNAGTRNDVYLTPLRVATYVSGVVNPFTTHIGRTDNPHSTTAAQVGAYSTTQTDTLLAGYVRLTDQWVAGETKSAFIQEVLAGTAANAQTVYGYTKPQLVAYLQTQFDLLYPAIADFTALAQRVTDIETALNSITVV